MCEWWLNTITIVSFLVMLINHRFSWWDPGYEKLHRYHPQMFKTVVWGWRRVWQSQVFKWLIFSVVVAKHFSLLFEKPWDCAMYKEQKFTSQNPRRIHRSNVLWRPSDLRCFFVAASARRVTAVSLGTGPELVPSSHFVKQWPVHEGSDLLT